MLNRQSSIINHQWFVVSALLAATLFRSLPLLDNRFHPDEALYGTFARYIASGHVLLAGLVVDKPPLAFYLGGLSTLLIGPNELAVRLPNFFASLVSVALAWALARRVYGRRAAHLAAWALALSPFAILFSITAFVDPLLTAFLLWGLWMTVAGRDRWAALAFTLGFATKQSALMLAPLALALSLLRLPFTATWRDAVRRLWRALWPMLIGFALVTLLLLVWDAVRHAPIGFWQQGYSDNMPGRFIRANEVMPRARAWLDLLNYIAVSPLVNALFIIGLPALLLLNLRHPTRAALADVILTGYLLLFLGAYWLLAFNVWDRYLVPLVPFFALLLARLLTRPFESWSLNFESLKFGSLLLGFGILLLPSAFRAAHSGYPIGGDHGAYDGVDDVARFVHTLPANGVLYDHWLSWEFDFYLFDRPLYISWFPTPEALTTDLQAFGRASPRYFVVPSWEGDAEMRAAAERAGFAFTPLHTATRRDGSTSFTVYQLTPISP
jgi:4-amino-4-deoxy-L-arabinose transferase-like glycosyltransferase